MEIRLLARSQSPYVVDPRFEAQESDIGVYISSRTERTKELYSRKEKTQGDHSSYFYILKELAYGEARINGPNNSPKCVHRSVAQSAYYMPVILSFTHFFIQCHKDLYGDDMLKMLKNKTGTRWEEGFALFEEFWLK